MQNDPLIQQTSEPDGAETADISLSNPAWYINRELSNLSFNQRVLAQVLDESHPLLERLRFLLIFSSNLDDFFQIRVAGLMQSILYEREVTGPDGLPARDCLKRISEICHELVNQQYDMMNRTVIPALEQEGISFLRRGQWTEAQSVWIENYVSTCVMPVISPIGLDPAHPFPRLVNKSLNFIVALDGKDAFGRNLGLAIVPAPRSLPRIVELPVDVAPGSHALVFLSSMIHAHADQLFPGMTVKGCYQFRITRNADLDVDVEGIEDLARTLRGELHSRRFGTAVRLEVADNCPKELTDFLLKEIGLTEDELYQVNGPVNLQRLMELGDVLHRTDLQFPAFVPGIPKGLTRKDNIFHALSKRPYLLLHPFESFAPVVQLVRKAAKDPDVVAIKQTLYRTGNESSIVDALLDAARNGKEVVVVVELRARFDEEENLELASRLQEAGAVVVYGVVGYKTHAKMMLIVRRENGHLRRYCHLGTGNYHSGNARLYTDYSLLTAAPAICEDIHRIFQQLTGMGKTEKMNCLYHAPFTLKRQLLRFIEGEIKARNEGLDARIIIKCNALTEEKMIQALYKASQAGVKIDLIVRGMCALRPGVAGISENIRVFSIVNRFLEHSRVYYFANAQPQVYCASADLMDRNLNRRVEICFPLEESEMAERVLKDLHLYLNDGAHRWELHPDGEYVRINDTTQPAAQTVLLQQLAKPLV